MMSGAKCRVLFVEDEAMISMLIEDMLLDVGVEVIGPATNLNDALALAQAADIEAAVLDINVGGAFTYPVADVLKKRGIPVIFATGYALTALPERFQTTPVLHKPFDHHAFETVLQAALASSPCEIEAA